MKFVLYKLFISVVIICLTSCFSKTENNYDYLNDLVIKKDYKTLKLIALGKIEHSDAAQYHKYLGIANSNLKDYENCIRSFEIYLNENSDDVDGYISLGDCYYKSGNSILAFKAFKLAYRLDSNARNVCFNLGLIEYDRNNFNKAIKYFTKELELGHSDFKTLSARADCFETKGLYKNAILDAKKAMEINASDYHLIHTLGNSQLNNSNLRQAKETFKNGLHFFPNSDEFHVKLASVYGTLGNYSEAIKECNKAIELNISNPKAHYLKALGFMNLENNDSACYYFNTAIDLDNSLSFPAQINCH